MPVLILAWLSWTHRSMFDDGYIYLHVVQNILAGNGPVFNRGQRVEVFTGPLWTFILAGVGLLAPFPLEWIAVVLGILMTLAGTSLAIVGSVRLVRNVSPRTFLLPLGAVVFIAVFPVWSLASMGLETGLTFLWLGTCLTILVHWACASNPRVSRISLVVLGLGPLVRPELLLDTLVFIGVLLSVDWSRQTSRDRIRLIAWAMALPVVYQVFRMGYYGEVVANTAIAKEATLPRMGRGFQYLEDFVGPYWLFVPVIALLGGAYIPLALSFRRTHERSRQLWALVSLPIAGILNGGYIVVMGGDYVHARLLMPAFFAVCAPVAIIPMAQRYAVSMLVVPWALICGLNLRPPVADLEAIPPFLFVPGHGQVTPSGLGWGPKGRYDKWYTGPGLYVNFGFFPYQTKRINLAAGPGVHFPTVAAGGIGTVSYVMGTNVDILDFLGLADPLTGHLALERRGLVSGHEKPLPTAWVAALLTANGSSTAPFDALQKERRNKLITPMTPTATGKQLQLETAWARAALTCPSIHDLEYSQDGPLTLNGFISNILRSIGRTELRIPPDPETAYHRFCGSGTPVGVKKVLDG